MKTFGNIIWVIFGGLEMAIGYVLSGVTLCLTIIGIPFLPLAFRQRSTQHRPTFRLPQHIYEYTMVPYRGHLAFLKPSPPGHPVFHHHRRHSLRPPTFQTGRHCPHPLWQRNRIGSELLSHVRIHHDCHRAVVH